METAVLAALIVASIGFVASVVTTVVTARSQHRLAWYETRRPHYIALVEASARSQDVQDHLADLLRDKASDLRVFAASRSLRRDTKQSAMDLRRELFAVRLVSTQAVFDAADRMAMVMMAGAVLLGRVSDEKASWPETAMQLDRLSEELFHARSNFVTEARRELRLKPLRKGSTGAAGAEDLIATISKEQ